MRAPQPATESEVTTAPPVWLVLIVVIAKGVTMGVRGCMACGPSELREQTSATGFPSMEKRGLQPARAIPPWSCESNDRAMNAIIFSF